MQHPGARVPTPSENVQAKVTRPSSRAARPPQPLGLERFKIQFTATQQTRDKLQELQALLRHQIPDGDLASIFERALDLLLRDVKRKKFADTSRPRAAREAEGPASRHIPAEIRRIVAHRDGGSCQYVSDTGQRCGAREFLEFHHLEAWARSRRHSVESLVLMCRAHNQYEGERAYGKEHMERCRI